MSPDPSAVPKRVWGATLLSALARQWSALCTLLAVALLSRQLSGADFGRFTFWLAMFALVDVVVDCGTSTVAVQRGAAGPAAFAAAIEAGRRIRLVAALLASLALAGGAWWLGEREAGWVALSALAPLARVAELSGVVFQHEIAWGLPLLQRALGAAARVGVIALLALAGVQGFGPYLAAHAGTLALGNVALHFVARSRLPARAPAEPGLFAAALPLAALGLCQQAYFHVDNLFVRALAGPEELGHYNAAVRLFAWLAFFAAFATTSALPWLARRAHAGELGAAVTALAQPLAIAACAGVGALLPWCAEILTLVYGARFTPGAASLAWLLGASVAVFAGAPFLTAVVAAGHTRAALGVSAAALGVNLAANAVLVPRLGGTGAAVATLVTESAVLVLALLVLRSLRAAPLGRPLLWLCAPLAGATTWLVSNAIAG
jgi:O-antigen/teichoic acid export membrane protein